VQRAVAVLFVAVFCLAACAQQPAPGAGGGGGIAGAATPAPPVKPDRKLIFTYYFYWYDATTGAHMQPDRDHLPASPQPTWRSAAWQGKQLRDMGQAGIDVALPVYWGFDRPQDQWSPQGLKVLAAAWRQQRAAGVKVPSIGMFFDTTIVGMRDLTKPEGKAWFYSNFKDFFTRIPRNEWALINGKPVIYLFTSDTTEAVNQGTFDYVYSHFQSDFGVRPYIVREVSWDYPILKWVNGQRVRDLQNPIKTDNSYLWAAAVHGYVDRGGVAAVGPGYDETLVPGRSGTVTPRQGGAFYRTAWQKAIASGKPLIAIETWDEMHEASDIGESVEYGRTYIDITAAFAKQFHAGTALPG
jgi:hypothetical protein